jgi:Starch-binding associating with outer membrane
MKSLKYSLLFLSLLLTIGCQDSLVKLNKNENLPTEARPNLILPSVAFRTANILSTSAWRYTDQVMQYHTVSDIVNFNTYDFSPGPTSSVWDELYLTLGNVKLMEANSKEAGLEAYLGAAYVLKAYVAATITELWIDAPFSEAGLGLSGNSQPKYDTQEEIYTEVLNLLNKANTLFSASPVFLQGGDVVYSGTVKKWQKLSNSLRLRYLLRLSKVSSVNAATQIASIINNPGQFPIFENRADEAIYNFSGVSPDVPAILNLTSLADLTLFNAAFVNYLQPIGDPRLDFFARKPTSNPTGPHVGIESGILNPTNQRSQISASRLNLFFQNPGLKDFPIMSFSELEFIRAEVALKGWTTEDPKARYESAITANMNFWGLVLPAGYFSQPNAAWNGTLDRLMQQKWVSFYNTGSIEAWGDYKRLKLPLLVPGPANVTSGVVPTRFLYPLSEQSLNSKNYNAAISRIGGDKSTVPHFYQ